jgi:sigma54-dependent transcription regulator
MLYIENVRVRNFESFDELSKAMWMLIRKYLKDNQPEKDIMIDFTGGQKVTSVVAAAVTFNRKIKAQYVQTKSPWDVLSFDVIHASSDTGSFGL